MPSPTPGNMYALFDLSRDVGLPAKRHRTERAPASEQGPALGDAEWPPELCTPISMWDSTRARIIGRSLIFAISSRTGLLNAPRLSGRSYEHGWSNPGNHLKQIADELGLVGVRQLVFARDRFGSSPPTLVNQRTNSGRARPLHPILPEPSRRPEGLRYLYPLRPHHRKRTFALSRGDLVTRKAE